VAQANPGVHESLRILIEQTFVTYVPAAGAPVNPDGSVSVEALLMDRSKLAPAVLFDLRASDLEPRVLAVSSRWYNLDLDLHWTAARQVPR
jgi:hypothetical protein